MPRLPFLPVPALLLILSLFGACLFSFRGKSAKQTEPAPAKGNHDLFTNARVVLEVYCSSCHNQGRAKIDLNGTMDFSPAQRQGWEKVLVALKAKEMPPPGRLQPNPREREELIRFIEQELAKELPSYLARWRMRRLQRAEYVNTIRDLFGIDFQPSADFPQDEAAWKRVQDLPPVPAGLLKKYQAAAEQILQEFMPAAPFTLALPPDEAGFEMRPSAISYNSSFSTSAEQARDFIAGFAFRAYRRPLLKQERKHLSAILQQTGQESLETDARLKAVLKTILTSAHFLYRIEPVSAPINPFEMASRLSYFLWNSMPDDELFWQAEQGTLLENLRAQSRRMLRDPKARVLGKEFANFWLEFDKLPIIPSQPFL
jgi:hypothetical protein